MVIFVDLCNWRKIIAESIIQEEFLASYCALLIDHYRFFQNLIDYWFLLFQMLDPCHIESRRLRALRRERLPVHEMSGDQLRWEGVCWKFLFYLAL